MATFSVALATYNGGAYLDAQLDSLAQQTLPPSELVACDDGSTDDTLDVLAAFAARAPFPVRVHRNPKTKGYVRNFLDCAARCQGDWVAFCDQDDVWLDDKLASVAGVARSVPGASLIVHDATVVGADLSPIDGAFPRLPRASRLEPLHQPMWFHPPGFTCTFRGDIARDIPHDHLPSGFFAPSKRQTADSRIAWLSNVLGTTCTIRRSLALYRRHNTNTSQLRADGGAVRVPSSDAAASFHAFRAGVAREYADELSRLATVCREPRLVPMLLRGAAYYGDMSEWYSERQRLYERRGVRRLSSLVRMARLGAWTGGGRRGLGAKAFARDVSSLVS